MTTEDFPTIPNDSGKKLDKSILIRPDGTVVDANLVYSSQGEGRIGVYVELPQFSVMPGNKIVVPITVINQGQVEDQFRISLEGVPPDWMLSPRSSVIRLLPGEQHDLKLAFQPPRLSPNHAGHYPLVVHISSQLLPTESVDAKVTLWLTAYSDFKTSLTPARLEAGDAADVRIQNLGNTQETYTINWDDPLKQLAFAPAISQVAVPPGDTAIVNFIGGLQQRRLVGGLETHPFTVTVSNATNDPQTLTGEIISKALVPIWALLTAMFGCCLLFSIVAFAFAGGDKTLQATQTAMARLTLVASPTPIAVISSDDPDGDGLTTAQELQLKTDPISADTDGDGLRDGQEIMAGSNPLVVDSDGDTLSDGREVNELHTSPINRDTDGDGLNDNVDPDPLGAASPTFIPPTTTFTPIPVPTNTSPAPAPTATAVPPTAAPLPTETPVTPPPTATNVPPTATNLPPTNTNVPQPTATLFVGGTGLIVFESKRDGNSEIYSMNPDGSAQNRLTNNTSDDTRALWSPDGLHLVFESKRDGNSEIYSMNPDGSAQTRLTNNTTDDTAPAWSPFGNRIAFVSVRDGNSEVYVMNADGSGQTRLTNNPANEVSPLWSPDGSKIGFISTRDGNNEIYVMNADGSAQTRLTNTPGTECCFVWSPNGARIAFVSDRDGNSEVYVMNADGSSQTRLTNNPAPDTLPMWSPDGNRIAFLSDRDGNTEIYMMSAGGTAQTRLTNDSGTECCYEWAPDGARLVFASDRDGNFEIYSLLIDPGNGLLQSRLTNNPAYDAPSMWRR